MDNVCMSVGDMVLFLEIMKQYIVSYVRVDDYIIINNLTHTHAYQEAYGEVCHILGYNIWTGEVVRNPRGIGL